MTRDLFSPPPALPALPDLPPPWADYLAGGPDPAPALGPLLAPLVTGAEPVLPIEPAAWFRAFALCPPHQVRVVILGQDPYPNRQHAMGLAFSVPEGVALPRSLANIYRELAADLGSAPRAHGDLSAWARQGVLLANAALTVVEGQPDSHQAHWQAFTAHWVARLGADPQPRVWMLWGAKAQRHRAAIGAHHVVIESAHPSPLSARRGFFGSRPFSRANAALAQLGLPPVDFTDAGLPRP